MIAYERVKTYGKIVIRSDLIQLFFQKNKLR